MTAVTDGVLTPLLSDDQRRELEALGYLVLPGVLTPEECDDLADAVDEVWRRQRDYPRDYAEAPNVQFTVNLISESLVFERCITEPVVLEAVRAMLGQDIMLYLINGRRSDPSGGHQPLHDLRRRRGRPFSKCTAIWCLDAFTVVNGATRVLPGSHLDDRPFLAKIRDPFAPHPDQRQIVAPRGAVIVFNAALIHSGTMNNSFASRRSIQSTYCTTGEETHYDWHALPDEIVQGLRPESLELLGLTPGTDAGRRNEG